jgi:hypothetical protein
MSELCDGGKPQGNHTFHNRFAGNYAMPNASVRASAIIAELHKAEAELVGKVVVLTDGKAGTVEHVSLDESHGLRISIRGHEGKWPVSTIKLAQMVGPEDADRLNQAYTYALRKLHLIDRNGDPVADIVARKIIEADATGISNPKEIAKAAIKKLGLPGAPQHSTNSSA